MKELLAQDQTVREHNDELQGKLEQEMKKRDGLLDEWMDLDEQIRIHSEEREKLRMDVDKQDEERARLKKEIEALQEAVDWDKKVIVDE
mmetsp:Transcript_1529/g.1034  ORF Transcript_1529/g.1034 Transcript_1529/m.1034 type:complete len:89 (+) Transcript_1529:709-975(+)